MTTLELTEAEKRALLSAWAIYTALGLAYMRAAPMEIATLLLTVELPQVRQRQPEIESLSDKLTPLIGDNTSTKKGDRFDARRN